MSDAYSINGFLNYLGVRGPKDDAIDVIHYDEHILLIREQSPPVSIDFYSISLKEYTNRSGELADPPQPYIYIDTPNKPLQWDNCEGLSGYGISISSKLLDPFVKQYSFAAYNSHEALFLTAEEKTVLLDLFKKAFEEYEKKSFARPVLVSYAALILSYVQLFYERQFQSRTFLYHRVIADFYGQLEQYFNMDSDIRELPTVAYFAQQANLSTNYFADLIKLFTGQSPQAHIHQQVIQQAKLRLRQTQASVSEIAYGLGFEYPTYFTRFFKKETGLTPTVFRQQ